MSQPLTGLPRKMSTQGVARALLVVLGVSLAVCLWISRTPLPDPPPNRAHPPGTTDAALYRAIVSRVRNGQDYTAAAVAEHRRLGYPLRPFFAVRPPALATLSHMAQRLLVAAMATAMLMTPVAATHKA